MTEEKVIVKLRELRQIKPKGDWVLLAKNQLFEEKKFPELRTQKVLPQKTMFTGISAVLFQKKFVYAFSAMSLVLIGLVSAVQYSLQDNGGNIAKESPAALVAIKSNLETFKEKSKNLADVAKNNTNDVPLVIEEIKQVAKEITNALEKDPKLAKEIALEVNNNKTYLDISTVEGSSELKETSDILYKTIDEQMIKDLEGATLNESQQETLKVIKDLYQQKRYANTLESILLLNAAMQSN